MVLGGSRFADGGHVVRFLQDHAAPVVIGDLHRDRGDGNSIEPGIRTGRRVRNDRRVRPLGHVVIDGGNDHGLGHVPIGGAEFLCDGHTGAGSQIDPGVGGNGDHHVIRGHAVQDKRIVVQRRPGLVGNGRSVRFRNDHPSAGVVVGDGHDHIPHIDPGIGRVRTGNRVDDPRRVSPLDRPVIHRGHRHPLGHVPVGGRERNGDGHARSVAQVHLGIRRYRHGNRGDGLRAEYEGVIVGRGARLADGRRIVGLANDHRGHVIVRDMDLHVRDDPVIPSVGTECLEGNHRRLGTLGHVVIDNGNRDGLVLVIVRVGENPGDGHTGPIAQIEATVRRQRYRYRRAGTSRPILTSQAKRAGGGPRFRKIQRRG